MTTVIKLIGKQIENIEENKANIKVCTKLDHSVMPIFTELKFVCLLNEASFEKVRLWTKKFSVKDAAKSGRPLTVRGKANVREIIKNDS